MRPRFPLHERHSLLVYGRRVPSISLVQQHQNLLFLFFLLISTRSCSNSYWKARELVVDVVHSLQFCSIFCFLISVNCFCLCHWKNHEKKNSSFSQFIVDSTSGIRNRIERDVTLEIAIFSNVWSGACNGLSIVLIAYTYWRLCEIQVEDTH